MSLTPGTRLGPYEILAPLGSGGMGEVFVARDTRLDRRVAIKVLRPEFAAAPDRRARFEREARAVASLSHPHVCTVHDVGEAELPSSESPNPNTFSVCYLVMEFLDGETLADRLARAPLSMEELLTVSGQIAAALDCAHRQGITHRDLKPGNIMMTRSGAKLLDFGLAKLRTGSAETHDALTRGTALTEEGTIVGTLQYMAPEQLEGQEVDPRTDLFAFGAIVYEMAAGRRAFEASSRAGVISAILRSEPPALAALPSPPPPALDRLVTLCLAKNPDDRWSSAHDVRLLLRDIAAGGVSGSSPVVMGRPRARERVAWVVAAAAVAAAGLLALTATWRQADQPLAYLSVLPPPGTSLAVGEAPQVSPDGRQVAFAATDTSGRTLLYVRDRESPDARPLPETDDVTLPFWAPDSARLGFFARGALKTIGLAGGRPQTLAGAPVPRGGTWSRDDVILFVPFPNELPQWIPASGGRAAQVPTAEPLDERRWFPYFLPDGRHYLYLGAEVSSKTAKGKGIRVASLDSTDVTDLVPSRTNAVYAEPGYLLYGRDGSLVAQPFDASGLALTGSPRIVAENVGFSSISYQAFFSASQNGALALLEPEAGWRLLWFDRAGRRLGSVGPPGHYNSLCFSGDGSRVVFDLADTTTGNVDIWSLDLASQSQSRLTFDDAVDFYPVCSPTGDEIVFASLRSGPPSLFRQSSAAPGSETALLLPPGPKIATDWSRDGRLLVFGVYQTTTNWDIWTMPLAGGAPSAFSETDVGKSTGRLSPDGRWMAYTFQEGAASEVYVQPFPATGAKWQVSHGGGHHAVWRADSRELFYISSDKKLVAVGVGAGSSGFVTGAPQVIAEMRVAGWERTNQGSPYAVTPDGQRFLVTDTGDTVTPITIVLNWTAARRAGPSRD